MIALGLATSIILPVTTAGAFCAPNFVNGNELEAPTAFAKSFENTQWDELANRLTARIEVVLVDGTSSTISHGREDATAVLRKLDSETKSSSKQIRIVRLALGPNHWVRGRLYLDSMPVEQKPDRQVFKIGTRIGPPPMIMIPHPPYVPVYSISFLPDCLGKIERLVIVDRMAIDE
jgi:limonene-1,2-epoxide hydrolase